MSMVGGGKRLGMGREREWEESGRSAAAHRNETQNGWTKPKAHRQVTNTTVATSKNNKPATCKSIHAFVRVLARLLRIDKPNDRRARGHGPSHTKARALMWSHMLMRSFASLTATPESECGIPHSRRTPTPTQKSCLRPLPIPSLLLHCLPRPLNFVKAR